MKTILLLAIVLFQNIILAQDKFTIAMISYPKGDVTKIIVLGNELTLFRGLIKSSDNLEKVRSTKLSPDHQKEIKSILSKFRKSDFRAVKDAPFPDTDGELDGILWYLEIHGVDGNSTVLWEKGSSGCSELYKYLNTVLVSTERDSDELILPDGQ